MKKVTIFCLMIIFLSSGCLNSDDPQEPVVYPASTTIEAEFSLAATTNNVAADGVSRAVITLSYTQLSNQPGASQMVTFTTNSGQFSNEETSIDVPLNSAQSNALVYLTHTTAETVSVTAQLQGKSGIQDVAFVNAAPQIILVKPDQATITNAEGQTVNLTAELLRDKGVPNSGQIITWSAVVSGDQPGIFVNRTRSSNAGLATAQYVIQNTTFTGPITFTAQYTTSANTIIMGSNIVFVKETD